uniref:Uncharacterized protein n=1 Tax=viral metagenome TaxID=1070528 RepID=A0A6M3JBF4_9ZZZZ
MSASGTMGAVAARPENVILYNGRVYQVEEPKLFTGVGTTVLMANTDATKRVLLVGLVAVIAPTGVLTVVSDPAGTPVGVTGNFTGGAGGDSIACWYPHVFCLSAAGKSLGIVSLTAAGNGLATFALVNA